MKQIRLYTQVRNGGHRPIRPGDWCAFKPHVSTKLRIVVKSRAPNADGRRFAGMAVDTLRKGETGRVQVYGSTDPVIVWKRRAERLRVLLEEANRQMDSMEDELAKKGEPEVTVDNG